MRGGGRALAVIAPIDHPIMTIWATKMRITMEMTGLLPFQRAKT